MSLRYRIMEIVKAFVQLQPLQKIFLLIAIATIFCSIFTDCILCKYYPLTVSANLRNPFEHFDDGSTRLVFFTVKWCSFCKKSSGVIDQLKTLYASGPITFQQIDAEEDPTTAKAADVSGYPTISLFKNGTWTKYTGARDAASIKTWADAQ